MSNQLKNWIRRLARRVSSQNLHRLLLLSLAISYLPVQAQEILIGEDGKAIAVEMPARGLTLFKTEGSKLLKVRHNQGELSIEADPEKGEVIIRPIKNSGVVSFFLVTETATIPINALIGRARGGAKSVIVRVPPPAAVVGISPRAKPQQLPSPDHVRLIKNLVLAAASGNPGDSGYEVVQVSKTLAPIDSLQVFHQATITAANGFSARRYVITNPTEKRAMVDERKFHSPDALAVAVESFELDPGDATVAIVVVNSGG